ncbi:MAG: sugar phosphate isomerase/epimerase, partial [Leeuwenhoekiella sp.]
MATRRKFLAQSGIIACSTLILLSFTMATFKESNLGVQLYTFRDAMTADARGTLEKIAALGIKQIESAGSDKGNYYGLSPLEMKQACNDLGMTLRSGHVHLDENWNSTLLQAVESEQEYIIVSSLPSQGQTLDNYEKVAQYFNKAGEECKKLGIKFGYHNHDFEFESDGGKVLYDVLLDNTDPDLVHMELDLGWVVATGNDPINYFEKYEGRFPLWHLKDMNLEKKESTEFGKGSLPIADILNH